MSTLTPIQLQNASTQGGVPAGLGTHGRGSPAALPCPKHRQRRRRKQRLDRRAARLRLVAAARTFAFAYGRGANPQAVARMVAHALQTAAAEQPMPLSAMPLAQNAAGMPAKPFDVVTQAEIKHQPAAAHSQGNVNQSKSIGEAPKTDRRGLASGEVLSVASLDLALPNHPLIVLYRPEIPPNAGSVARLCAAFRMPMAIVGPIGFELSARAFRRAGLDYWPWVPLTFYGDWNAFTKAEAGRRFVFIETTGTELVSSFAFSPGDALIFGSETSGLPQHLLTGGHQREHAVVRIRMWQEQVRSINLANAVSIVASHALSHPNVAVQGPLP